jgi:AraC-like DNA-binding protein
MDSLWLEARADVPDQHWHLHAGILTDLIVASLESSDNGPSITGDPLFKRMQDMIDERLDEFDFGPMHMATDLGVPLRTLQATAARAGTTIGKMITAHRIQRAARLLLMRPDQSVTQIALDCGFADPSYFARRFQQALGSSPRKYRLSN